MQKELYEILAQGASYWFAFLGVVIVWRSFAWLRKDSRLRRKRVRQLPDAGLVGEMVVIQGNEELPEGMLLPLPLEGVLGSLRSCDLVVPAPEVAGKHLTFQFIRGKGVMIEPWLHQRVWVDGEEYSHRGRKPLMRHGSRLQVGEAVLRLRLFMGVDAGRPAPRQEEVYQPWPQGFDDPQAAYEQPPYTDPYENDDSYTLEGDVYEQAPMPEPRQRQWMERR